MNNQAVGFVDRTDQQKDFENSITTELNQQAVGSKVDIATLVNLQWDTLCTFTEGDSFNYINQTLGFDWINEDGYLYDKEFVVFVDGTSVATHLNFASPTLIINPASDKPCIQRNEAIFEVAEIPSAIEGVSTRRVLSRIR
ncbi:hypothetical protein [Herpetosiphon giganteus]|uniref:hypothetical protein n=1 Tax=Herpetosiphon giganteus TaxID=2029754 RepID=UPI001957803F|nr:hypothetical protein [Herpetosiphon giganteus]MBM7841411.1 hypothetical protein [Herpetosiphon giganteus]